MPTTFANSINNNEIYAKRAECDAVGSDIQQTYATKSEVTTGLSSKQDTIADLATIRSGAQAGSTAVQPGDLATVATTGAYSDLSGTPTIPTATSDLTNDSGFITLSDVPAQVNADWNAVSGAAEILNKPTIPSGSDLVPPYTIPADEGKVLTIGPSTTYWAMPAAGSVTDVEVDGVSVVSQGVASITMPTVDQTFDSTSADAQSGVAIAGELANINQVPASTSADSGKVLTVDSSGIPGWVTGGGGSTGLFEAVYGVTTYADVVQAIADQKIVYCRVSPSGASRMAFLAYIGSSNVEFQYYRSLSNHSASNQTDEVYVYTVSSSGWTTTTRLAGIKYIAGTNMSQSYNSSNSTLTFNATMPTVDQTYDGTSTNAQSGTAVAGAIAGVNQVPASTSSDSGKVLTVDSNGDPQWATGGGGSSYTAGYGIYIDPNDNNAISVDPDGSLGGISVTSQGVGAKYDGTTINVNASNELQVVNPLPASTSSDSGKVLTVDSNGDPGWVTGGGGGGVQSDWTEADPTSMAYIENKPTPKTLTAGDNVTITETSSTITVSASWQNDEVVLYSGMQTIGNDGAATYNLSELPTNFQYIRIYYCASDNTFSSTINGNVGVGSTEWDTTIYTAPNTSVWLLMNGNGALATMSAYNIQANLHNIRTASWSVNGFLNAATGNAKWFHIYKIVGIHRIAND